MDASTSAEPPHAALPCTADEIRGVRWFVRAMAIRAWLGTALWAVVHTRVPMTAALVASCWLPWWMARRGAASAAADRARTRSHVANAGLVVFLATALWTLWGLVLAGRGTDLEGGRLAALWTFLFLCFVVDFWLFRRGLAAVPERDDEPDAVT